MKTSTNIIDPVKGLIIPGCALLLGFQSCNTKEKEPFAPNIIFILADDLGYGDLSCYGQKLFDTPNIDRMATEGLMFTQHYSGSTVSAPSRSALLTGQHTGHTPIRGNVEIQPEGQSPLPAESITIAEILRDAGYTTGAFGKWGLGFPGSVGDPVNQGFDVFFGYNCQRYAHRYYPQYLWFNTEKVFLPGNDWTNKQTYAPDFIQEKVLEFIEQNNPGKTGKPFFLYYPTTIPHAELIAPQDSILDSFIGKFPETPFPGGNVSDIQRAGYGANLEIAGYCPQEYPKATFAAMVTRLDYQVGEIMSKLEELGIAENTIIFFTSDNGPHLEGGADPDFFDSNGPLKGYKRDLYEGGVRAPMIVRWKNHITPGRKSEHISAFWDIMPTFADLANTDSPEMIDGISFLPEILGKDDQPKHEYLYWEFERQNMAKAIRKDSLKLIQYIDYEEADTSYELYNLKTDIGENNNLSEQFPKLVNELKDLLIQ